MIVFHPNCPPEEFQEQVYLNSNPDIKTACTDGRLSSGWEHFYKHGFRENRPGVKAEIRQLVQESYGDLSLIPPDVLHNVGGGDFIIVGSELLGLLVVTGGLKPSDRVLDVGCGTGRVARPLSQYLTSGSYAGIDIVKDSIDWCQETYRKLGKDFNFYFSDIYNKMYNSQGICQAKDYKFPFADGAFDFIFLTSVFTHMFTEDMENYLAEITRVLAAEGTCFITFFLLNEESLGLIKTQSSDFSFPYQLAGCRVEREDLPENAVAFSETDIRQLYAKYNLEIQEPIRYGRWCARKVGLSYQDIIVAQKKSS